MADGATVDEIRAIVSAEVGQLIAEMTRAANSIELLNQASTRAAKEGFSKFEAAIVTLHSALELAKTGYEMVHGWLHKIVDATAEAEKAQALLTNALKATGGTVGFTADQLKDFAEEMSRAGTMSTGAILNIETKLLSFRNVTGDVFERATQAAIDFASATGRDGASAARVLGMALNDPIQGMGRLRLAGISLTQTVKDQIKSLERHGDLIGAQTLLMNEFEKAYKGADAAMRQTIDGSLKALHVAFGNLLEGTASAPALVKAINDLVEVVSRPELVAFTQSVMAGMIEAFAAVVSGATELVAALSDTEALDFFIDKLIDSGAELLVVGGTFEWFARKAGQAWEFLKSLGKGATGAKEQQEAWDALTSHVDLSVTKLLENQAKWRRESANIAPQVVKGFTEGVKGLDNQITILQAKLDFFKAKGMRPDEPVFVATEKALGRLVAASDAAHKKMSEPFVSPQAQQALTAFGESVEQLGQKQIALGGYFDATGEKLNAWTSGVSSLIGAGIDAGSAIATVSAALGDYEKLLTDDITEKLAAGFETAGLSAVAFGGHINAAQQDLGVVSTQLQRVIQIIAGFDAQHLKVPPEVLQSYTDLKERAQALTLEAGKIQLLDQAVMHNIDMATAGMEGINAEAKKLELQKFEELRKQWANLAGGEELALAGARQTKAEFLELKGAGSQLQLDVKFREMDRAIRDAQPGLTALQLSINKSKDAMDDLGRQTPLTAKQYQDGLDTMIAKNEELIEAQNAAASNLVSAFANAMGEVTKGILAGTRDWKDILGAFTDIGISELGRMFTKTIETKIQKFDTGFRDNLLTDIPQMFTTMASSVLGIFDKLWESITGSKIAGLDGFFKNLLGGGGGDGGVIGNLNRVVDGAGKAIKTVGTLADIVGGASSALSLLSLTGPEVQLGFEGLGAGLGQLGAGAGLGQQTAEGLASLAENTVSANSALSSFTNILQGVGGAAGLGLGLWALFNPKSTPMQRVLGAGGSVFGASALSGSLGGPTISSLIATQFPTIAAALGIGPAAGGAAGAGVAGALAPGAGGGVAGTAAAGAGAGGAVGAAGIVAAIAAALYFGGGAIKRSSGSHFVQGVGGLMQSLVIPPPLAGLLGVISGDISASKALEQTTWATTHPLKALGFEMPSKGQMSRRYIGNQVLGGSAAITGGLQDTLNFDPYKSGITSIQAAMAKFPELWSEAGNAATAFGTVLASALKSGQNDTKEYNFIVETLIDNFGQAGVTGPDAINKIAGAFKEMKIDPAEAARSVGAEFQEKIAKAMGSGNQVLADQLMQQFAQTMQGLEQVASTSTTDIVNTMKKALGPDALTMFDTLVAKGVESFQAVEAASNEAFMSVAGTMEDDMLPRAQLIFQMLTEMGITSADAIQEAFNNINFEFPEGTEGVGARGGTAGQWFVGGSSGKLFYGTVDKSGKFVPAGGAPPTTGAEQGEIKKTAPKIPGFALGGVVPGLTGAPQMSLLHAGETVVPTQRGISDFATVIGKAMQSQQGSAQQLAGLAAAIVSAIEKGADKTTVIPVVDRDQLPAVLARLEREGRYGKGGLSTEIPIGRKGSTG